MNLTKAEKRKLVELSGLNGFHSAGSPPSAVLKSLVSKGLVNINIKRIELTVKGESVALNLKVGSN